MNEQISRMRTAGQVAPFEEERNAYRVLVGKPEGTKILARCRRRIKIGCRGIGW